MSVMPTIEIHAVLYQEGSCWIAQGLEHDITAQADSLPDVHDAFTMKVLAEVGISLDLGKEPLEGIDPAPPHFWKMYKETPVKIDSETPPVKLSNQTLTPRIIPRMKVGLPQAA